MTAVFDTRPPVVKQTVTGAQVPIPSSIAALGNTMAEFGVSKSGYILTGIINAALSGATAGSPKAIYMGGTNIQIVNASTTACRAANNILYLSGTFIWARNNLGI